VEDFAISNESIVFGHLRYLMPYENDLITKHGIVFIIAEHLKNASLRLASLLAINFTVLLIHGILPDSMLSILLVLVIKAALFPTFIIFVQNP